MVYFTTSDASIVLNSWQSPTPCFFNTRTSPPCRTFQSDKDSSPSPPALLLVWTSELRQRLLQLCTTCSRAKPVCHKPYGLLKQLPIPRSLGFNLNGFHREAPSSSSYTSILVIVVHLSKQSLFIPITIPLVHLNLHNYSFYTSSPSMVSQATSLPIVERVCITLLRSLGTALDMKLHFTSGYHPNGNGQLQPTNQI